jgi:uncharacterized protein
MAFITSINELEALYLPGPVAAATAKETDHITADYARIIEASPFVALATAGPDGLDCSPRGDRGSVVRIVDQKTLHLPDRRGNNRIDSLRNIVVDPRVALLFLIPGSGTTMRINATATLRTDPDLLNAYAVEGGVPRCVIEMTVRSAYFQCARAIIRSDLWNPERHVSGEALPSPGDILANLTNGSVGGKPYDEAWPERAAKTMW